MDDQVTARGILNQLNGGTVKEIFIRIGLLIVFFILEVTPPFHRIIHEQEAWMYKYPTKGSIPPTTLYEVYFSNFISFAFHPTSLMVSGVAVILIAYGIDRKISSASAATASLSLALPLTGVITNMVKAAVGRPRPDFFSRCYGPDYMSHRDAFTPCINGGNDHKTMDGRRSFPSGHAAMSFCIMGFISLYINRLLEPNPGRFSKSWKYLLQLIPLLIASLVAISRTCEYKHHYEDVIAGTLLGLTITYSVFNLYFPPSQRDL